MSVGEILPLAGDAAGAEDLQPDVPRGDLREPDGLRQMALHSTAGSGRMQVETQAA